MNKFEQMVYLMLEESDADKLTVEQYITDPDKMKAALGEDFFKKYEYYPSKDELLAVRNAWEGSLVRTNAAPFKNIGYLLPIIYLVHRILVKHALGGKLGKDSFAQPVVQDTLSSVLSVFKTHLNEKNGNNPIDFNVTDDPQVSDIKRQIKDAVGSSVGQLALTKFNDNNIKDALYQLLAARKVVRSKTLKPGKPIPEAGKAVEDVLREPKRFTGGHALFNPKLSSIYTEAVEKDILSIAIAAHAFYNEQVIKYTPESKEGDTAEWVCETDVWDFITNATKGSDSKFTFTYNNGTSTKQQMKAEEVGVNGYTINNIRENLVKPNKSQGAKLLYKELEDFANYIRKQEPFDLVGKLQATASGLKSVEGALGIKM